MELNLNVWKRGSQRVVHKPLLMLYVLNNTRNSRIKFY